MKIRLSDIHRFIQLARNMWRSNYEGDFQIVVFNFTENCCSIATARNGLLLTYLCNLVDGEASGQVIAVPFELLRDSSYGIGVVDLQSIVENEESCITAKWSDGLVHCERMYAIQDPPEYHLIPDLAWHTIDGRMVWLLQTTEMETGCGEMTPGHCESRCPIEPIATTTQ